ncbi:MAG TPA: ImmA/IrrE family metallo-endopeptidase [Chloroflexia bacterium]|nr:ImmA/IrrE family metallo-endopeptidase [Chloroflexia bacterium]
MWLEAALARQAEEFWELAGGPEPFPRRLVGPASLALPVTVHELHGLTLMSMHDWLQARGVRLPTTPGGFNQRLRGCLVASRGRALILIDGSDHDDERRFTLAHELAHLLIDYREPRREAVAALGESILPVLNGERPPTHAERLHAILDYVPLGLHVDMMERTSEGSYTSQATLDAEERANLLALELLAPAADAWAAISALADTGQLYFPLRKQSATLLCERYGLPATYAHAYAGWLLKHGGREPGIRDWLD